MRPGYYRDNDTWLHLSSTGKLYYLTGPDTSEPAWRDIGPPMSDDAELKTPPGDELALFQRTRMAYGIPE
jgi:hypothetical protein